MSQNTKLVYILLHARFTTQNIQRMLAALFLGIWKIRASAWYTGSCMPGLSGELGDFCKIYFIILTSVTQSISPVWKMPPLTIHFGNSDKETMEALSSLLTKLIHMFVHSLRHVNDAIFFYRSSLIALDKTMQTVAVKTKAVSHFKTT